MRALSSHVGRDAGDVSRTHGFGPIPGLPSDPVNRAVNDACTVARRTLEQPRELSDGYGWRVLDEHVDMVVCVAGDQEVAPAFLGLVA